MKDAVIKNGEGKELNGSPIMFDDTLSRYLAEIRKFPMLAAEEERDLSRAWRDRRDPEAARRLAGSHLRFVVKISRGFSGYGLPLEDLLAEGNVGLMQAVEKFDPERGFRFATYAQWWIRAAIQEYILHNWSLVKLGTTAAQKKLFFNLRRLKGQMQELEEGDLSPATVTSIATELGVAETEVVDMNRRLASGDWSLNATSGDEESDREWQDMLTDDSPNPESMVADADERVWRRGLLNEAMKVLNDRERHIIIERRLKDNPVTLEDLGRHYGVTRERVRQIEVAAFNKLQKAVRNAAGSFNSAALPAAA